MKQNKFKIWLEAFRLRTLPLALANAVMGSLLAASYNGFRWSILILTVVTITALQILSNLANDYGDAVSGKDTDERVGFMRVTASGLVTKEAIKRMIIIFIGISMITGSALIFVGLNNMPWQTVAIFYVLGLASIVAAIKYTMGKNPYGYRGRGDIFVFIFFGLVGVLGTFYMHTQQFEPSTTLPAIAIGLMSVGVLNINNLRDVDTDRKTRKISLVVKHGKRFSQVYHLLLISGAFISSIIYVLLQHPSWKHWLFVLTTPLFAKNCFKVFNYKQSAELNGELKNLAISTFLFALVFGVGMVI